MSPLHISDILRLDRDDPSDRLPAASAPAEPPPQEIAQDLPEIVRSLETLASAHLASRWSNISGPVPRVRAILDRMQDCLLDLANLVAETDARLQAIREIAETTGDLGGVPPLLVRGPIAARLLGISEKKLRAETAPKGSIPYIKSGRRKLYDLKDLEQWIDDQKILQSYEPREFFREEAEVEGLRFQMAASGRSRRGEGIRRDEGIRETG